MRRPQIVIPVIGDIGRTGSLQSVNNGNPGCPTSTGTGAPGNYFGWQANQISGHANFGGAQNTDDDIIGPWQQGNTASYLNTVCANLSAAGTPCNFVLNTGDNFYQCGADDYYTPGGFPLTPGSTAQNTRLYSDWFSMYQTSATPAISSLPWYSVLGNHDMTSPGSVDLQIAYSQQGKASGQPYYPYGLNWNMPSRYYSVDYYTTGGSSVRVIALNTNPCNAQYVENFGGSWLGKKTEYSLAPELLWTATEQYINAQMVWLNATMIRGYTVGCGGSGCKNVIVMSHYGLYATDAAMGSMNANDPAYVGGPTSNAGTYSAGALGRFNCFGQIQAIFSQQNGKYAPTMWVNGHDHTNAVMMNADYNTTAGADTIFVTSGTGSLYQAGDGMPLGKAGNLTGAFPSIPGSKGAYPYHVLFSSPSADGSVANGGISVVTITPSQLKMDVYVTQNGPNITANNGGVCDIGATGAAVWSQSGAVDWTQTNSTNGGNIQPAVSGGSLLCNLCTSTPSDPAVCSKPLSTWGITYSGPSTTPSGYLTYAPQTGAAATQSWAAQGITLTTPLTSATPAPGVVVKAYTCTANTATGVSSCGCNVAGYPAAGFQTAGNGFAICQNMPAFYAAAASYPGFTPAPAGVQGPEPESWMIFGSPTAKTAALSPSSYVAWNGQSAVASPPPATTPSPTPMPSPMAAPCAATSVLTSAGFSAAVTPLVAALCALAAMLLLA